MRRLDTVFSFCPDEENDDYISKIISRAKESRQLIKLLNRGLKTKTIDGIQLNIEGYPMLLENLYGFMLLSDRSVFDTNS
ncbi:hypothetical protein CEXT_22901 [Caerostris extrusa]|uniref:Uncharacterized protein n=1 Tax=Caerostris extrusa TaxID=172846 RepID=A0AAV4VAI5_CAEEX|nr:hypothetical protein CEXT_22901 [Caerostris extrusa]